MIEEIDEGDGFGAGLRGLPLTACPWKPGTPEGNEWAQAWTSGTSTRRMTDGQLGATIEEKAAAGLAPVGSIEGRGHGDDVHELWRPKRSSLCTLFGFKTETTRGQPVDLSRMVDQLRRGHFVPGVGPPHVHTFTAPDPGTYDLTVGLTWVDPVAFERLAGWPAPDSATVDVAEPTDPKERALYRKQRKGFTCHRHGIQPGGFCRTCQRGR